MQDVEVVLPHDVVAEEGLEEVGFDVEFLQGVEEIGHGGGRLEVLHVGM